MHNVPKNGYVKFQYNSEPSEKKKKLRLTNPKLSTDISGMNYWLSRFSGTNMEEL